MYEALSRAVNNNVHNNTLRQCWEHNFEVESRMKYSVKVNPHQWDQKWQMVRQHTSVTELPLESLDGFHVFVLAQ